jgi:hypothetical protein
MKGRVRNFDDVKEAWCMLFIDSASSDADVGAERDEAVGDRFRGTTVPAQRDRWPNLGISCASRLQYSVLSSVRLCLCA